MNTFRDRFQNSLIPVLFVLSISVGSVSGQNTHLQNLIQTYKEQNAPLPLTDRAPGAENGDVPLVANVPPVYPTEKTERPIPPRGNPKDPLNIGTAPESPDIPNPYDEMALDARLNDIFFVDPFRGWAVGDRGAIWHTSDGGESWALQETPICCSLKSVHFLNESFGLAVGGYLFPFTTQGRGVVLLTADGGKNWSILPTPHAPIFHRVKMFDPMKGLLAGESSEHCPSGLFATVDGGRTWKPLPVDKNEGWISADFIDEKTGFGIGSRGSVQLLVSSNLVPSKASAKTRYTEIKMVPPTDPPQKINGWMVGEGGLVYETTDRGHRWSVVSGKLPGISSTLVDLNTIEARGPRLWVAGNPGTLIYRSNDYGKTWTGTPTGVSGTIRKVVFLDDMHGWAVGDLGTILSTIDGGAHWKRERSGATRLSMLGLFGRAEEIPLEAFVRICADQGYLGGVMLMFHEKDRNREGHESILSDRVREAMVRVGASGTWQLGPFSLERSELATTFDRLVDRIQSENDGKGIERIRERLVAAIRQWRPEIILTSGRGDEKDPVRELLLREVLEAVKMADDPTSFPNQITELDLKPWKVKKVHLTLGEGLLGDVNIPATEPLVRLGQPIDELAYVSHGILETDWKQKPAILGFSTPWDDFPATGNRDFFAGLDIPPGADGRRALTGSYADRWEEVCERVRQRRNTLGIIQHMAKIAKSKGRSKSDVRLASNAAELTRKIDRDAAVQILLEMGKEYHAVGDWESALEAYDIIVRQHATHPLARHAFQWILRYYAAEELGRQKHRDNIRSTTNTEFTKEGMFDGRPVVERSVSQEPSFDHERVDPRLDTALQLAPYLMRHVPDLADEAVVRFALASVLRRKGMGHEAANYYKKRGAMQFDDVWGMRARAEYWLALTDKSELPPEQAEPPMPSILCSFTSQKPYLDGRFDKEYDQGTWFRGKLYSLTPEKPRKRLNEMLKDRDAGSGLHREEQARSESKNLGTQAIFMYDKEYLYVGIRCKRAAGFSYPPIPERPRLRDADIGDRDRVEILLDTDRDYGTYYSLTVDSRGWAVDACWGDKSWNPNWYVARQEDKNFWYIEAAIPFESLTERPPMPQTVWGVGVRRIVPGVGIECWNAENSFDLTEGLGFLVFE